MERLIDITRAARVAGVPASEIERHVAEGRLPISAGRITLNDLGRLYPEVADSRTGMVEYVSQVKDDVAVKRRKSLYQGATREELQRQLDAATREAAHYKSRLDAHRRVLLDIRGMLLALKDQNATRQRCEAVIKWLERKLESLA